MNNRNRTTRGARGFTLVEILITVAVIAVLTAIAVPAYISVVSNAQDSAAKHNLSSAAIAENLYTMNHQTAGSYTDKAGLIAANLASFSDPSKIQVVSGASCFVAGALSASGTIFYVTDQNKTPTTTNPGTGCATLPAFTASISASTTPTALIDGSVGAAYNQTLTATGGGTFSISVGSLPAGLSLGTSTGAITGTPTTAGTSTFTVMKGGMTSQVYSILIKDIPPTMANVTLPAAAVGSSYTATVSFTGLNVTLTVSSGSLPAGLSLNTSTGKITGTPTTAETSTFTVTATNSGGSASQANSILVNDSPPTITNSTLAAGTVGSAYTGAVTFTGNNVTFAISLGSLPAGLSLDTSTGAFPGTPTTSGTSSFTVKATNGGGTTSQAYSIVIKDVPPTITNSTLATGTVSSAYTSAVSFTGQNVTLTVSSGSLPAGLSMNTTTGTITGTPTTSGTSSFTVKATNSGGTATQAFTITIKDISPTIASGALPSGTVGSSYTATVSFTGLHVTLTVSSGSLPAGLSLNTSTGAITGTPTTSGTSSFTITATNTGGSAAQAYSIVVKDVPPTITSSTMPTGTVSSAYSASVSYTGLHVTFALSSGSLPSGLSLNTSTGAITGTPTTSGTSNFTVTATNTGGSAAQAYSIVVKDVPPTITSSTMPTGTVSSAYSASVSYTGLHVTFALSSGSLPSGLSLNTSTGAITGTPTTSGTSNFTVTATNTGGSAAKALSITINDISPTGTGGTVPVATVGSSYSATVSFSGLNNTLAVTSGSLPPGLSLNSSTGAITGTPTTSGTYNFTVTATNSGGSAAQAYSIVVHDIAPTINSTTMPNGTAGSGYSAAVSYTGLHVTFAVTSGSLPSGLNLNTSTGAVTGTPTASSVWNFTITASNSGGSAARSYSISIKPATPTGLTLSSLEGQYANIRWNAAAGANDYVVTWGTTQEVSAGTTHTTHMATGQSATFTVQARSAGGILSAASAAIGVTIPNWQYAPGHNFSAAPTSGGGLLSPTSGLVSQNGQYDVVIQADGNLVVYSLGTTGNGTAVATYTSWTSGANNRLSFGSDGNLVVYNSAGTALDAIMTQNQGATVLILGNDGNLVVKNSAATLLWTAFSQSSNPDWGIFLKKL